MDRVGDSPYGGPWRLIESGPADGAFNMAVDIAVQRAHSEGCVPPTLRVYTWSRPTVSLGRFQDPARGIDLRACGRLGIDVVRRPTGGRAILHTDDVTYSIVCRSDFLRGGRSVVASYKEISAGICRALRLLGLDAGLGRGESKAARAGTADCFSTTSLADVVVDGLKTAGSAQCRHDGVILQQGTIPLRAKPDYLVEIFADAAGRGQGNTLGLEAVARRPIGEDEMISALRLGFEDTLRGPLGAVPLTEEERQEAQRLAEEVTVAAAAESLAGALSP